MKHFVNSIFNGLFFGNIFIAMCAMVSTAETAHLLHLPHFTSYYLVAVFCGTIIIYGCQSFVGVNYPVSIENNSRLLWLKQNKKGLLVLIGLSVLIGGLTIIQLPLKIVSSLLLAGVISMAYFIPGIELRKKPFAKSILIAVAWVFTTTIIPVLFFSKTPINNIMLIVYTAKNTLFIYNLCLIFDNRDVLIDKAQQVKTFASFYSEKRNNVIIYVCITVYLFIALYTKTFFIDCIISIALALLTMRSLKNKSELFYLFYVDGLILLKALLVLCFI